MGIRLSLSICRRPATCGYDPKVERAEVQGTPIWVAQNVESKLPIFWGTSFERGVTPFRPSGGTRK